eukprot:4143810-Alexandrium_andersonii.AAC.1
MCIRDRFSSEHLLLWCPAVWLPLNSHGSDSAAAGLLSAAAATRAWAGRLLRQASFLAYSWEGLASPGPEVAATRL